MGELDAGSDPVRGDQAVVSGVSVNLQDAAEALQDAVCMLPAATGGIVEGHTRRRRAAPGPVITRQGPEVSGLGLARPRVENRGAGLVHEELG